MLDPTVDKLAIKLAKPAANAVIPAPAAKHPTPIKVIAAPNIKRVGASGVSNKPATPITVKAPANIINPAAICPQLILPNATNTGANILRAPATINKAAAPASVPVITVIAAANITNEPAKVTRLFAIPSQDISPIILRAAAKPIRATLITVKPTLIIGKLLGIMFTAPAIINKAPAIVNKPFPISVQDKFPNFSTATANTFIAAPIINIPVAVEIIPLGLPISLVNITISDNITAIEPNPLINSLIFNPESCSTACVNTTNDVAKSSNPVPLRIPN